MSSYDEDFAAGMFVLTILLIATLAGGSVMLGAMWRMFKWAAGI